MKAVEGADQLPPENIEAMERVALLAAQVEAEGTPVRVRVAAVAAEDIEIRLPFGPAISRSNRTGQRRVEGVVRGDPEQLARGIVDEVRQLLDPVVEEAVAGVQGELALDFGDGGEVAKDDWIHAPRINEIRAGSKVKCATNPQI